MGVITLWYFQSTFRKAQTFSTTLSINCAPNNNTLIKYNVFCNSHDRQENLIDFITNGVTIFFLNSIQD